MPFISVQFVFLLTVTFLLYWTAGPRLRKPVLLVASCIFIGYGSMMFLAAALAVSIFTYVAGLLLEKSFRKGWQRPVFWCSAAALVAVWVCVRLLAGQHWRGFVFPLGISFYTFQSIAYLTEIYWEEDKPERNLMDFLIYMLLFMKFLSGPIERPADLLPQIRSMRDVPYQDMTYGLKLVLAGLLKKLAFADHVAPYVDAVFASPQTSSGIQLLMAGLLYPFELYADFSGYTDMALGCAMLFGLRLSPNFDRPFAAGTTSEFWRRWHMSLSFWVRDYLYIPMASATRGLGQYGVMLSLIVTFVLLGLWHGIGWTFAIYGLIQGLVIVWEMKTVKVRSMLQHRAGGWFRAISAVRTYLIFAFSLVFFKSGSLTDALWFIRNISFSSAVSWKEMNIGMSDHICIVSGAALLLIFLYDRFMARTDLFRLLERQPAALRWTVYYLVVIAILAYGKIGEENFIYLQF